MAVSKKDGIEFHPGSTNILLIAPHGHPDDDENTGKIVRALAEQNGCYAIINEYYRKPKNSNNDESADKKNKRVNLNRKGQVEAHLQTEFLDPLTKFKNEIVEKYGNPLIFWIYGAEDESVEGDISDKADANPKDVKVLVGWGQKTGNDRHTADKKMVNNLIDALNANGLNAVLANPDKVVDEDKEIFSYCGWGSKNMNQLFRAGKYKDQKVQSIQLEFRMNGCRDTDESIETTAKNLAYAISALVQPEVEETTATKANGDSQGDDKAQVPERISDPEEVKDAIEVGGRVYDPLVETAYQKLSQVFSKNYERALMEAGQYIVRTFYGGEEGIEDLDYDEDLVLDKETIENARVKKTSKEKTLHQLFQKLDKNSGSKAPSRGWIYNAVNLVVQRHDMKKLLKTRFHTYGNLFLSHKVALLKVKDLTKKQEFVYKEAKNPSTVKEFNQKIKELTPQSPEKAPTLPSILKKPDELVKEENVEKLSIEALKSIQARRLEKLKTITEEQHKNIEAEIETLKQDLENRQQCFDRYAEVKGNIEKAIQFKNNTQQRPKKKASKTKAKEKKKIAGFQEWTKKENTVNICTGCANDCKYCYAKSMAYRFKRVPEGEWTNQIIRDSDVNKKRKLYDGRVGFPTSHDITPHNLDAYLTVLKKLFVSGNKVLIVSKPNLECIKKICETASDYKNKILFRFTIGAMNNDVLRFWNTNAPLYEERKESLKYAFDNEFQTSVSMEPLLDSANVVAMATDLEPFVTDAIWIGKMNHTSRFKTGNPFRTNGFYYLIRLCRV